MIKNMQNSTDLQTESQKSLGALLLGFILYIELYNI